MKPEEKCLYGTRWGLQYPYFTFDNENYNEFMILMLSALEMRRYLKDEIITNEMDESFEILFVELGRYDVGYEVNKKPFYRLRFGESTQIGGFQILYFKRHNFVHKASTMMLCQAIRKERFL